MASVKDMCVLVDLVLSVEDAPPIVRNGVTVVPSRVQLNYGDGRFTHATVRGESTEGDALLFWADHGDMPEWICALSVECLPIVGFVNRAAVCGGGDNED